ncbi:MAG TPA: hypothetical protein VFO01_03460 [Trebonia sp.]|nr:hypothetical protein [Trebonia sp.]
MAQGFEFENISSTVSMLDGDGIVVHVVNDSTAEGEAQVIIYENTGAGANTVTDSGVVALTPTWQWSLGYTVSSSGEYWMRIRVSSQDLIPMTSFERLQDSVWVPVVTYRPGDFAVFKIRPRERIW